MRSDAYSAESNYDVFLSYNSADHDVVEEVARKLRSEGLEPFLDRWALAPGTRWRLELEKTLGSCQAVAIFVGPGEMGSWQQRELDVALDLQSKNPKLPVIPVLLPGSEPPLGFLRQLTWVDLRIQTLDRGMVILVKAARGESPGPDLQKHLDSIRASICPYRGLLHFREEDAPFFFGREASIDKLMDAVQRQYFVAVVSASGSGKSSVVRAGLVPRLRSDRRTAWETVILVPTDQPLKALARALISLLEPAMDEVNRLAEASKLAEHFRSGTISLYDIVERILEKHSGTNRVLIVVDQFEELYTLTSDQEARRHFLDELLAASSRAGSKVNIVLTVRGDFVGKALAYRPLSDRLQDSQINLGPMTREELECAIRKPAQKIQLEFESGLVRRILNDVGDEPGNLPLLEFVLKELWNKRRGHVLLNETYDAIGGLQGAVATKADEILKGLSRAEQRILQRVFLRIVRPSEGSEDTRRRAAFSELSPEAIDLVTKLANERLLVTNQSASGLEQTVEVAHEALISNWGTLRGWVNEDREFLLWRERLGALLTEWERAQKSDEALPRGSLLVEAQKWFDQRSQDLSDQERKFISASRMLREQLAREEKGRQEREIEAAKKLVEEQKRGAKLSEEREKEQKEAARKLRRLAIAAGGAAASAVILFATSVFMWRAAQDQARISTVQHAAAEEQARIATTQRIAAQYSEEKANDARDQADGLINFMLYDLRDKLEPNGRLDVLDDVAKKAQAYLQQSLNILRTLVDQDKSNIGWQRDLSWSYQKVGEVLEVQGRLPEALDSYYQGLAIAKRLTEQDKSNTALQRGLLISYTKIGSVLEALGRFPEALDAYQQYLTIARRLAEQDKSNTDWQRELLLSHIKVGGVLETQGKLPEALDAYQQGLAIAKHLAEQDKSNTRWQQDLLASYMRVGGVLEAQQEFHKALDAYQGARAIATALAENKSNTGWQPNLSLGYEKVDPVLEAEAPDAYQQYLLAKLPQLWAAAQYKVGDELRWLGSRGDGEKGGKQLEEAVAAYRSALEVYTKNDLPQKWAMTEDNLGITLEALGNRIDGEEGRKRLEEAVAAYRSALEVYTKNDLPQKWAVGQDKLGNALQELGKRSDGEEGGKQLEEAVAAYRSALEVYTMNALPQKWAMIQTNLGITFEALGSRNNGEEGGKRLEEAVAAYRSALEVYTMNDLPQKWAMIQTNLGITLEALGSRNNGEEGGKRLEEALAAFRSTLAVYTKADLPQKWAMIQTNLGITLAACGSRNDGEEGGKQLEEAVAAYRSALEVYSKNDLPQEWTMAENDLGSALWTLGNHLKGEEGLKRRRESVELYRNLVSYQPNDQSRYQLASALGSLAFNLVLNSQFAEAQTRCEEAQRLANEISDGVQRSDRDHLIFIQGNLAHVLLFQGYYDEALAIYRQNWDKPLNGKTFGEATLEDFAAFDKAGLTHPDLSRMKRALEDLRSKAASP
jgi:tetratricopeptide (TPR) repeat protein